MTTYYSQNVFLYLMNVPVNTGKSDAPRDWEIDPVMKYQRYQVRMSIASLDF